MAQELRTIGIIASLVRVLIMYMSVGSYSQGHSEKHSPLAGACVHPAAPTATHAQGREEEEERRGGEGGKRRREGRRKEGKKGDFRGGRKIVLRHNGAYIRCAL